MGQWGPGVQLIAVLALGFVLRLALAPSFGGFGYDTATFQNWAATLDAFPVDEFYNRADAPDHLPGDLWIMKALVGLFRLAGGENFEGPVFVWCLKLVPAVGDVAAAVAIHIVVSVFTTAADGVRAAAWYILNPLTIFVTVVWGQWDSVSLAILLVGFCLIVKGGPWWTLSSPWLVWAVLIKPQLAVPAVFLAALILFRFLESCAVTRARLAAFAAKIALSLVLALTTALAILVPFSVGLPGMETKWSLTNRLQEALDLYPYTTLGAANVWMIPWGSLDRLTDESPVVLGLAPNQWGSLGLAVALLYVAGTTVIAFGRTRRPEAVCWTAGASMFAIFMLPTRVHERYLFPVLGFTLLLAALHRFRQPLATAFWTMSVVFTLSLLVVYGGFRDGLPASVQPLTEEYSLVLLSCVNVVAFGIFLCIPWLAKRRLPDPPVVPDM